TGSNSSCMTSNIASVTIVSPTPAFSITATNTLVCSGQTVVLSTTGTGSVTWNTGATTPTIAVTSAGSYSATVTNGCGTPTNQIDLISGNSPTLSLTASASTLCSGGTLTLTANGTGTVAWGTGTITASQITVTTTGIYTATLTNECGSDVSSFTVSNGPLPVISIVPTGIFCNGQTVTLTASGASTYSWNTGVSGPVLSTNAAAVYTAVGTNSCGTSTNTFDVTFTPLPTVSLTASQLTICPNQSATLTATGQNGGSSYSWNSLSGNGNVQTVSSSGNYVVTYTNSCGTAKDSLLVSQSLVNAGFTFNPNGGTAPVSIAFTNSSSNYTISQWDFGNGQTSSNTNEGITYQTPGIYSVTLLVQNSDGCAASVTETVEILPGEFGPVPEVITPNGDNNNDYFKINGIERYTGNELYVYNRWGNLVYSMKGYTNSNAWDGKPNANGKSGNNKLPPGTYYYLLILNDDAGQVFKGFVELMY
ncbi:MAG: T9SS type B sorting domain-containing protein, partial [Bacteroidia bacterium]